MADLKISQLPSATQLAGTEVSPFVQNGTTKRATVAQVLSPAALGGINYAANGPFSGVTSQLLNWYEEGVWTPNQGAGMTVVGTFSSVGKYTRIGRQVIVNGTLSGSTSIASTSGGVVSSNIPYFTNNIGHGSSANAAVTDFSIVVASGFSITSARSIVATPSISFTATYFV